MNEHWMAMVPFKDGIVDIQCSFMQSLGSMMFEVFKKTLLFKQFYAKLYPALPAMVALLDF
jgi:hypothetical protein